MTLAALVVGIFVRAHPHFLSFIRIVGVSGGFV